MYTSSLWQSFMDRTVHRKMDMPAVNANYVTSALIISELLSSPSAIPLKHARNARRQKFHTTPPLTVHAPSLPVWELLQNELSSEVSFQCSWHFNYHRIVRFCSKAYCLQQLLYLKHTSSNKLSYLSKWNENCMININMGRSLRNNL